MRHIHDADVIILMATTLSSKRRPAELVEIVAAADLLQGSLPFVEKLDEAMRRLSTLGLIHAVAGGFTLTAVAQQIMAKQPRKGTAEELLGALKDNLATYRPKAECPAIQLTMDELTAAIQSHKASRKTSGKNLLMPKPKPDRHFKVEGRWRRVVATR